MKKATVKPEMLGFRDEALSRRHRTWGVACPAADIDLLMVEYNWATPAVVVEYKHKNGLENIDLSHTTYRAISALADGCNIPFFVAVYDPVIWCFTVIPVNHAAKLRVRKTMTVTELQWVRALYRLRNIHQFPPELAATLNTKLPITTKKHRAA